MLLTPKDCFAVFGDPNSKDFQSKFLMTWDIPADIQAAVGLPDKLYCHRSIVPYLEAAFRDMMKQGLKFKTFDGCWNIRKMRGLEDMSIHSWALAIDVDAAWNGLGKVPTIDKRIVICFTSNGFDWGGSWQRKDGMHFQLKKELIV